MKRLTAAGYLPPSPNFYSGHGEVLVGAGNLPHWSKLRTACFVTFRLADSLPVEKLAALEEMRDEWLRRHPQPWTDDQASEYYAQSEDKVQHWLDQGHGACLLADEANRQIVEAALWHFAGERYALYAYVVMPNHLHVLFMPTGENIIRDIVASWKRFTAHEINARMGREGAVWQKESFDTLIRSQRHFDRVVRYIRENDLRLSWAYDRKR